MPDAAVSDDAADKLTSLLADLVAFPTESRTPNVELIRWVAGHVESNGGRATVLEANEGRANPLLVTERQEKINPNEIREGSTTGADVGARTQGAGDGALAVLWTRYTRDGHDLGVVGVGDWVC